MGEKMAKFDSLLVSVNVAIIESADALIDVRKELGQNLIEMLDELQYTFYLEDEEQFYQSIVDSYMRAKELIGFTLID